MKPFFRPILMSLIVLVGGFLLACCNLERASSPTPTQADVLMPADSNCQHPHPDHCVDPG